MWHGRFSIILTKAAFLHVDYLQHYTHKMPPAIREYVEKGRQVSASLICALQEKLRQAFRQTGTCNRRSHAAATALSGDMSVYTN